MERKANAATGSWKSVASQQENFRRLVEHCRSLYENTGNADVCIGALELGFRYYDALVGAMDERLCGAKVYLVKGRGATFVAPGKGVKR